MKLTASQLRKIVKEEVAKVGIAEGPEEFYRLKATKLEKILVHIESIGILVDSIESDERRAPGGDVEELRFIRDAVDKLEEEVAATLDAVKAML
jgi:hypothetical protein